MATNTQHYQRFLEEKHQRYVAVLDQLLNTLTGNDLAAKVAANKQALEVGRLLRESIAEADRPEWLNASVRALEDFDNRQKIGGEPYKLLKRLIPVYQAVVSHTWDVAGGMQPVDFDAIYERCRRESQIAGLFDEMMTTLEKIVATGEIDSMRAHRAIQRLIATIKRSKSGSYFAVVGTWQFIERFIQNYLWEQFSDFPIVGPLVKALRTTAEEMKGELEQLHVRIRDEVQQEYGVDSGLLPFRSVAELGARTVPPDISGEDV